MAVTPKPPRAILDFETRSPVSLRKSGTWRYSIDPHTEALCMAYRLPHWEFGRTALWHPAFPALGIPASNEPELRELFEWIAAGGLVEAHNSFFERSIWLNIMRPRHGFPGIGPFQWRDSAVKAAAHALPRSLDDVTTALRLLIRKDKEGAKVMMKVSKPRKMRKKEREEWAATHGPKVKPPILYHESKELFERLFTYCRKDVLAEEAVSDRLPDCPEFENQLYALDQIINERGFALDRQAVDAAIRLLKHEAAELNQELSALTAGAVTKATQRQKLMAWFETQGLKLFDTQKTTLEDLLKAQDTPVTEETEPWMVPEPMTPAVRRGVEILRTLGRASTAKYEAMRNWMAPDDRAHGTLLFHGASTGRFTGMGIQPHNFPRGSIKHFDMDVAWEVLKHCGPDEVTAEWGSVSEPLSCALRGAITASPGKLLYVADFASIEARVVQWLARDEDALGVFRRHEDPYCDMASAIYNRPINKKDHPVERQIGKFACLGLSFQMGASKFAATCAAFGVPIEEDFAQQVVETYRQKFWRVKNLWRETEEAAIKAVLKPKFRARAGRVSFVVEGTFLYCELPSGRRLAYPFPEIKTIQTSWGQPKESLTFMGVSSYSHKWTRQTTYGGMLVENCLAGETEVLTLTGWTHLQDLKLADLVWDGVDWVVHSGLIEKGVQPVISCDGIRVTTDHQIRTTSGWRSASSCQGYFRSSVWLPHRYSLRGEQRQEVFVDRAMRVRDDEDYGGFRTSQRPYQILRLQMVRAASAPEDSRNEPTPRVCRLARHVRPLSLAITSRVEKLRGTGYSCVCYVAKWVRTFLGRYGVNVPQGLDSRTTRQRAGVLARQLLLGHAQSAGAKQAQHHPGLRNVARRLCRQPGGIALDSVLPTQTRVFDIRNCGPRNQFVVRNANRTRALIVHNCTQAVARDVMAEAMWRCQQTGTYEVVLTVHDEVVCEAHPALGDVAAFVQLLVQNPKWAPGLPVEAEGWAGFRYRK